MWHKLEVIDPNSKTTVDSNVNYKTVHIPDLVGNKVLRVTITLLQILKLKFISYQKRKYAASYMHYEANGHLLKITNIYIQGTIYFIKKIKLIMLILSIIFSSACECMKVHVYCWAHYSLLLLFLVNVHLSYDAIHWNVNYDIFNSVFVYQKSYISRIIIKLFLHARHPFILNQGRFTLSKLFFR